MFQKGKNFADVVRSSYIKRQFIVSRMRVLKSREVFTDTCFSHSYMTLFPGGVASFGHILLFMSSRWTIPLVVGWLESTVRTWRDTGSWSLGLKPLRYPKLYSQEGCPVRSKTCPGNPHDSRHGGDCGMARILGKVKHYSEIPISDPRSVPSPCVGNACLEGSASSHRQGFVCLETRFWEPCIWSPAGVKSSSGAGAHFSLILSDGRVRQRAAIQPAVELG